MANAGDLMRARMGGVQRPKTSERGQANTLQHVAEVEMYLARFADTKGKVHEGLVFMIGGKPFYDLQSENWQQQLTQLPTPVADALMARIKVHREGVKPEDVQKLPLSPPGFEEKK